jgi:TRAP-type transport system periplasmic protein
MFFMGSRERPVGRVGFRRQRPRESSRNINNGSSKIKEAKNMQRIFSSLIVGATAALLVGAFVVAVGPVDAQAKTVIKIGSSPPAEHPENVGAFKIKELAEAKAGDKIEVQVFPNRQLGDQRTMVENMRAGLLDVTWVTVGFFGSYEPILNIIESGYLFQDEDHALKVFNGPLGDQIRERVEKHQVKLLGFFLAGVRQMTNNARPVNTPDDLKGLKIRVPQSKYHLKSLQLMGANAVSMSFAELYTALQQGVVDGQENPLAIIHDTHLYEVQKHLSLTDHLLLVHMVMYSEKIWNKLPADIQAVMREAVKGAEPVQWKAQVDKDASLLATLKEKGMAVNKADKAAFKQVVLPLRQEAIQEYGDAAKKWFEIIDQTK